MKTEDQIINKIIEGIASDNHSLAEDALKEYLKEQSIAGFQDRVNKFLAECFGKDLNKSDRVFRFLEEALELAQACGCSKKDAKRLVDYVYGRPIGLPSQEIGGVMVTLAALSSVMNINLAKSSFQEIERDEGRRVQIREKHNSRPKNSPLPGTYN
jgi:hypothetical protein